MAKNRGVQIRRRARKRQPLREALFAKEYRQAQSIIPGDNFEECRDRVGLLLLFLTGLRVRSLLLTTGGHLSKLLKRKTTKHWCTPAVHLQIRL